MRKSSEIIFIKNQYEDVYSEINKQIKILLEAHNSCILENQGDRIIVKFSKDNPISGEPIPYMLNADDAFIVAGIDSLKEKLKHDKK